MFVKRHGKRVALVLSLILVVAGLSACQAVSGGGKVEIIDSVERAVSMDQPAQKIVALVPADVEILYAIGAQDKLIAVGEYCNYPPEAQEKDVMGTGANLSIEQLIAMQPDLLIMGKMAQAADQVQQLSDAGITVYVSDAQTTEDMYDVMEDLGTLSGKTAEAEALIAEVRDGLEAVHQMALENPSGKKVYVEVSPLPYGLYSCGYGTFIDELLAIAGGNNAFGDQEGWVPLSEEQVIAANPDVILTTTGAEMGLGDPIEEICARPGWDVVAAVSGGWVSAIDADACTRPGPRLVKAANEIYEALRN
jgi:iron complex transport system substrate-binding protein